MNLNIFESLENAFSIFQNWEPSEDSENDYLTESQEVANFLSMSSQSDTGHTHPLQLNGSSFEENLSGSAFQARRSPPSFFWQDPGTRWEDFSPPMRGMSKCV